MLSFMCERIVINPYAFDDYLHERYGNYENERGMSMEEVVRENYGEEGVKLIHKLI